MPALCQECGTPVGINPKLPGPSVCVFSPICDADAAFQNVEALFKRVQVRLNGSARIEKANAGAHVHRSHGAIHIGGAAKAGAVRLGRAWGSARRLGRSWRQRAWRRIYYGSYPPYGRQPGQASRKLAFVNRIVTWGSNGPGWFDPFQVRSPKPGRVREAGCASKIPHNSLEPTWEG